MGHNMSPNFIQMTWHIIEVTICRRSDPICTSSDPICYPNDTAGYSCGTARYPSDDIAPRTKDSVQIAVYALRLVYPFCGAAKRGSSKTGGLSFGENPTSRRAENKNPDWSVQMAVYSVCSTIGLGSRKCALSDWLSACFLSSF